MKQGPQAESGGGPLAQCWAWLAVAVHGPLPHWAEPAGGSQPRWTPAPGRVLTAHVMHSTRALRRHGGDAAPTPRWCGTTTRRCSTMDLGVVAQLNNGQGTGNKRGILTDDVQATDRGRRRGFVSARRSGTVVLGYRERKEAARHRHSACSDSAMTYMEERGA
jgi:hypothetical protein